MYLKRVFYDTVSGAVYLAYLMTAVKSAPDMEKDIQNNSVMRTLPREQVSVLEWTEPDSTDEAFRTEKLVGVQNGELVFEPFDETDELTQALEILGVEVNTNETN